MLPIPSGSYILCQYVDDWMSVGGLRPHIVVTRNDGVVFKRIENDLPRRKPLGLAQRQSGVRTLCCGGRRRHRGVACRGLLEF